MVRSCTPGSNLISFSQIVGKKDGEIGVGDSTINSRSSYFQVYLITVLCPSHESQYRDMNYTDLLTLLQFDRKSSLVFL